MTIPARVRRRVHVDDQRFDWCASRDSSGLSLYVEGPPGQLRVAIVDSSGEDDSGARLLRPVTPHLVERVIRWARADGWSPEEPGLRVLRYADGWGVPEPEPTLDEREVILLGNAARLEVVVARPALAPGADEELIHRVDHSGLLERPPYAKAALDLRLVELSVEERELVLLAWHHEQVVRLEEAGHGVQDPSAIAEHAASLGGGLTLWTDNGEVRILPECCCTLASLGSWREAEGWRELDRNDLWTGHPWCVVRYQDPYLWIEANTRGRPLAILPRRLRRLLNACEEAMAALHAQVSDLLGRRGLPPEVAMAYADACIRMPAQPGKP